MQLVQRALAAAPDAYIDLEGLLHLAHLLGLRRREQQSEVRAAGVRLIRVWIWG